MGKKKILIVGSNGIIGKHISDSFQETFDIYKLSYSNSNNQKNFTKIDLTNKNKILKFVESCFRFDTIIYLVGLAHSKGKGKDLPMFQKINFETVVNFFSILEQFNKLPNKIIYASSISVYGEKYFQNHYSEKSVISPSSPYGITKYEAEKYLLSNYPNFVWVLRFGPVYSNTFSLNIDRRTKIGNFFFRVGSGEKKVSLCNIKNVSYVCNSIINNEGPPNGVYNLTDQVTYSYNDLLSYQKAKNVLPILHSIFIIILWLGKISRNIFIYENSIKLLTDNIYLSKKISKYIEIPFDLKS